jgi:ribosomal protein S12 methylthiotransferase
MKTRLDKSGRINMVTLGCAKNVYDSEILMGHLNAQGVRIVNEDTLQKGDTVIINTCGFIQSAREESINTILEYAKAKTDGIVSKLFVVGCLTERYRSELAEEIPEVDRFIGVGFLPELLKDFRIDFKKELVGERMLTSPGHFAYLKISEGCNHKCSFCAIPGIKGAYVSKPMEVIIREAEWLVQKGVKELIVIAQDTTYYGKDIYGRQLLAELLTKLPEIKGVEWVRLQYAFPSNFPYELLQVISDNPKICKYLDIPFQHISDSMLKIMRRGISKKKTLELINQIRKTIPEVALRTTLIVGHPGESKNDFLQLQNFVEEAKFDRLGVFAYSHEEVTYAYRMKDATPQKEKQRRLETIMEIQRDISLKLNQSRIGQTHRIILDRKEGDYWIGRTQFDSPEVDNEVLVKESSKILDAGNFYNVQISAASEYDLEAVVI